MTDNEIIKALECCSFDDVKMCDDCPYYEKETKTYCANDLIKDALDLINRQKAEIKKLENIEHFSTKLIETQKAEIDKKDTEINILIRKKEALRDEISELKAEVERLQGFYKPTETSGYKIENGKVIFYTNMLNGYRHEYENLDEVVKELNMMLQRCYLYDDNVGYFKSKIKELRTAKSEAIKEFAERFKKKAKVEIYCDNTLPRPRETYCIEEDGIDNLVKEMTEAIL